MSNRLALLVFGVLSSSLACPKCGCGNLVPPMCLAPPSPYEAMSAALALPSPISPAPAIPAECYAQTGPILDGCGPPPTPLQIIQAPPVVLPGPLTPIIPLPAPCMPPPQVIAHKCVVSKAVVKPQIYQRVIQVPTVARFLKKAYCPVLENIAYSAVPQCDGESCSCGCGAPECTCGCSSAPFCGCAAPSCSCPPAPCSSSC